MILSQRVMLLLTFLVSLLFAQTRPFPQQMNYPGCIKPSGSQTELNRAVTDLYDYYKANYVHSDGGYYYIEAEGNGPGGQSATSISEANGYGMIITALMAGYDSNAKTIFDGLNALRKEHKSVNNENLMSWVVCDPSNGQWVEDAATDGDMDNAYGLLLGYIQWGDATYLEEAKDLLKWGIKESEMSTSTYRTMCGDWDDDAESTRSSDWMAGHMRAFAIASGDNFWNSAANMVYTLAGEIADANTGMIPDFISGALGNLYGDETGAGTNEENADAYSFNACRVPLRFAVDYAHHQTSAAKKELDKLIGWFDRETGGDYSRIYDGYTVDGDAISNDNSNIIFAGPLAAGAIATGNQSFLDNLWSDISVDRGHDAYSLALNILSCLVVSGNWWAPYGDAGDFYSLTVNNGTGSGAYEAGDRVAVSANSAPAGYKFKEWTGDISGLGLGTGSSATITMPAKNISITAVFEISDSSKIGPDLIQIASWEGSEGDLKSTVSVDTSKQHSANTVSASISLTDNSGSDKCWGKVSAYPDGKFDALTRVSVTYKSDEPLWMTLDEEALSMVGEAYGYLLAATNGSFATKLITIGEFAQPTWVENSSKLTLSNVISISLAAETKPGTSNLTVTEMRVDGFVPKVVEEKFKVTVTDGSGSGEFAKDAQVKITADKGPVGYKFVAWTGDIAGLITATDSVATFAMPAKALAFTATYEKVIIEDGYTVTVNSGSGSGIYKSGTSVSMTANDAPIGYEFSQWSGDVGSLFTATEASVSFTMPKKDLTFTAEYTKKDIPVDDNDFIAIAGWEGIAGTALSEVELDTSKQSSDNLISAVITLDGPADNYDCWGKITGYVNGKYDNIESVTITYSADEPVLLTLDEIALDTLGASYGYELPGTNGSVKTITIAINQFAQPDWVTEADGNVAPLRLENVSSISLSAVTKEAVSSFAVSSLVVKGFEPAPVAITTGTAVTAPKKGITVQNGNIVLNGFDGHVAQVTVIDLHGRQLLKNSVTLTAAQNVALPQNMSRGVYILSVEGIGARRMIQKFVVR